MSSVGETEPLTWERYIENLYLHLSSEDIKDPSTEASLVGGKFFTDIWENGGQEMAQEIIRRSEKGIHDARKVAEAAEKSAEPEVQIGIDYWFLTLL